QESKPVPLDVLVRKLTPFSLGASLGYMGKTDRTPAFAYAGFDVSVEIVPNWEFMLGYGGGVWEDGDKVLSAMYPYLGVDFYFIQMFRSSWRSKNKPEYPRYYAPAKYLNLFLRGKWQDVTPDSELNVTGFSSIGLVLNFGFPQIKFELSGGIKQFFQENMPSPSFTNGGGFFIDFGYRVNL
ncbi:MAG: hypothetical protein AAFV07_06985, partial [Bacteroidota bacterium]